MIRETQCQREHIITPSGRLAWVARGTVVASGEAKEALEAHVLGSLVGPPQKGYQRASQQFVCSTDDHCSRLGFGVVDVQG